MPVVRLASTVKTHFVLMLGLLFQQQQVPIVKSCSLVVVGVKQLL